MSWYFNCMLMVFKCIWLGNDDQSSNLMPLLSNSCIARLSVQEDHCDKGLTAGELAGRHITKFEARIILFYGMTLCGHSVTLTTSYRSLPPCKDNNSGQLQAQSDCSTHSKMLKLVMCSSELFIVIFGLLGWRWSRLSPSTAVCQTRNVFPQNSAWLRTWFPFHGRWSYIW